LLNGYIDAMLLTSITRSLGWTTCHDTDLDP
jgi:hypothetical protein